MKLFIVFSIALVLVLAVIGSHAEESYMAAHVMEKRGRPQLLQCSTVDDCPEMQGKKASKCDSMSPGSPVTCLWAA